MKTAIIKHARATPVRVPARPDSLNSEGIDDCDATFAAKFQTGAKWSDFPLQIKWIVELKTADGTVGIGETYRSAELADIKASFQQLLGKDVLQLDWRRLPCSSPRAYDAIESAVMDLAGKTLGVPVYQLLGGACRASVECSGWTGRRTPADAARKAHEAMQRGHRVFKFKCSDTDSVRAWSDEIRRKCGDRIRLLLDPNQRWHDVATTMRLMDGVPREIMYALEDPVARSDYAGFRELRGRLKLPIFVHISLPYRHQGQKPGDLLTALREDCADGFNFNGPMFDFVSLAQTAALAGKQCWHGSEVDCGILEASALHAAAAAPNCTIPSDIFGELARSDDLIEEPIVFDNGCARVPRGAGLGVTLDRKAVAKFQAGGAFALSA